MDIYIFNMEPGKIKLFAHKQTLEKGDMTYRFRNKREGNLSQAKHIMQHIFPCEVCEWWFRADGLFLLHKNNH